VKTKVSMRDLGPMVKALLSQKEYARDQHIEIRRQALDSEVVGNTRRCRARIRTGLGEGSSKTWGLHRERVQRRVPLVVGYDVLEDKQQTLVRGTGTDKELQSKGIVRGQNEVQRRETTVIDA